VHVHVLGLRDCKHHLDIDVVCGLVILEEVKGALDGLLVLATILHLEFIEACEEGGLGVGG